MKGLLLFATLLASSAAISLPGTWGYATANETFGVNYFYWFFEPTNAKTTSTSTAPLVLWLTGGPGCSSELALFFENGPYQVNTAGTGVLPNPYGWNSENYLLYVDQPGGTGFSTVKNSNGYVVNEAQVALDMVTFLKNLFAAHPNLGGRDFFIFGESYAGHYVPAIASYIVANEPSFNLKGIAIGNGFIDPAIQTASFAPFIQAHGLLNTLEADTIWTANEACQEAISLGSYDSAFTLCGIVLNLALEFCSVNKGSQCNVYNIEAPCVGQLCYDFTNVVNFLNNGAVQKALGVSVAWDTCDTTPYEYLINDFDRSYVDDLPLILAAGVPVTIYEGNLDIICNYFGQSANMAAMSWPGQTAFNAATNQSWVVNGTEAGTYRTAQGLTYVVVYNAGHMVPHDQPAAALNLMLNVLNNNWSEKPQ